MAHTGMVLAQQDDAIHHKYANVKGARVGFVFVNRG